MLCRTLRKNTGVLIAPEDLVNGIRKLLNENAAIELAKIKIDIPTRKKKTRKPKEASPIKQPTDSAKLNPQDDTVQQENP